MSQQPSNKYFCILPWMHFNLMPDGKVIPCCVSPYDNSFAEYKAGDGFESVVNSPKFNDMRKAMLNGERFKNCEYCFNQEESGHTSMRRSMNHAFRGHFDLTKNTNEDGSIDNFKMLYLDFRTSNVCNFKCNGCSPELSSSWHAEYEKLFNYKNPKPAILKVDEETLIKDVKPHLKTIETAYFAGGEPFLNDFHYKVLEELISMKRNDVKIVYNTNLSILKYKQYDLLKLWSNFERVELSISIDDIGKRAEYYRKGTNWKRLLSNILFVKASSKNVNVSVNCTVSLFNIYFIPELIEELLNNEIITPVGFLTNPLFTPEEYSMWVLPKSFRKLIKYKFMNYSKKLMVKKPGKDTAVLIKRLLALNEMLDHKDLEHLLPKFRERTKKLDEIRGDDFRSVYPELSFLMKEALTTHQDL